MKRILTSIIILFFAPLSWGSDPNKLELTTPNLFLKLKSLYEATSTPYPVESIAIKSAAEGSRFSGCAYASSQGSPVKFEGYVVAHFKITVSSGAGPLSPAKINQYFTLTNSQDVQEDVSSEARFENGVVNLDTAPISAEVIPSVVCKNEITAQYVYKNSRSGLSSDKQSYEIVTPCSDGRFYEIANLRQSGDYLVAHHLSDGKEAFFYCWK